MVFFRIAYTRRRPGNGIEFRCLSASGSARAYLCEFACHARCEKQSCAHIQFGCAHKTALAKGFAPGPQKTPAIDGPRR